MTSVRFNRYKKRTYFGKSRILKRQPLTLTRGTKMSGRPIRASVYSLPIGMPEQFVTRLKYSTEFSINTLSTNPSEYIFKANGLYDPDYSGVGHQPMYFDQIRSVYHDYVVLSSKITCRVAPSTVTAVTPCAWGIALVRTQPTVGLMSGLAEIMENEKITRPRFSDGTPNTSSTTKYNAKAVSIFSAHKFFNVSKSEIKDNIDEYGSRGTSSDPAKTAYYECWTCPVGGNDPGTVNFVATIEYVVLFKNGKVIAQS